MARRWATRWQNHKIVFENSWTGNKRFIIDDKVISDIIVWDYAYEFESPVRDAEGRVAMVRALITRAAMQGTRCYFFVNNTYVGGNDMPYNDILPCPKCGNRTYVPVPFVFWGGFVWPKRVRLVRCVSCKHRYGGCSGKSNAYYRFAIAAVTLTIQLTAMMSVKLLHGGP